MMSVVLLAGSILFLTVFFATATATGWLAGWALSFGCKRVWADDGNMM